MAADVNNPTGSHGCVVCRSPERGAIEQALADGYPVVEVSRRFTIKRWALWYHREGHEGGRHLNCRLTPFLAVKLSRLAEASGHKPSAVVRILILQATTEQLMRPIQSREELEPRSMDVRPLDAQRLEDLRQYWEEL
jgi:hypothetical protein